MFGLAAEASAQAMARHGGASANGAAPSRHAAPPAGGSVPAVRSGTCPCGLPASGACIAGCGRPVCGDHLLNRSSRLGWNGPYRSEREHTAYLRAFWANHAPLCSWCRETAANGALAAMEPVAPLPAGVVECLAFLLRHPHDYPRDTWDEIVRRNGGTPAVLRLLAPRVCGRKSSQGFEGRRKGEFLSGVSVGGCSGEQTTYEVLDGSGSVWTVRPLTGVLVRKRRAWSWEPTPADRVAQLLPRIVELAAT